MLKKLIASFLIPLSVAVSLIALKDTVLVDPNLIRGKDGTLYTPYDDYGPRDVDVAYGLVVVGFFWTFNRTSFIDSKKKLSRTKRQEQQS